MRPTSDWSICRTVLPLSYPISRTSPLKLQGHLVAPEREEGVSVDERPQLRKLLGITGALKIPVDPGVRPRLHVLLVHADVQDSETIVQELGRAGYTVQANFAGSRYEFAVKVRALPHDLIVCDYVL